MVDVGVMANIASDVAVERWEADKRLQRKVETMKQKLLDAQKHVWEPLESEGP